MDSLEIKQIQTNIQADSYERQVTTTTTTTTTTTHMRMSDEEVDELYKRVIELEIDVNKLKQKVRLLEDEINRKQDK